MTWKELKEFCEILNDKDLEENVLILGEKCIYDISAEQLKENHYVDKEWPEDGSSIESQTLGFINKYSEEYPQGLDHFMLYKKGLPVLII